MKFIDKTVIGSIYFQWRFCFNFLYCI